MYTSFPFSDQDGRRKHNNGQRIGKRLVLRYTCSCENYCSHISCIGTHTFVPHLLILYISMLYVIRKLPI